MASHTSGYTNIKIYSTSSAKKPQTQNLHCWMEFPGTSCVAAEDAQPRCFYAASSGARTHKLLRHPASYFCPASRKPCIHSLQRQPKQVAEFTHGSATQF